MGSSGIGPATGRQLDRHALRAANDQRLRDSHLGLLDFLPAPPGVEAPCHDGLDLTTRHDGCYFAPLPRYSQGQPGHSCIGSTANECVDPYKGRDSAKALAVFSTDPLRVDTDH